MQQQHRSPSNPIPVPQIVISPQEESAFRLRRQSPDSPEHNLNADMAHQYKRRSASSSPCRRGRDIYEDKNRESLEFDILAMPAIQARLRNAGQIDLSASAPEYSLRQWATRQHRLYSAPTETFLGVPQLRKAPSMSVLEERQNGIYRKSYTDLDMLEALIYIQEHSRPPSLKSRAINAIRNAIKRLGLSPRSSPPHSPTSLRSVSPNSSFGSP